MVKDKNSLLYKDFNKVSFDHHTYDTVFNILYDNLYNKVLGGQRSYFSMEYNKQNNGALLALNFPIK